MKITPRKLSFCSGEYLLIIRVLKPELRTLVNAALARKAKLPKPLVPTIGWRKARNA